LSSNPKFAIRNPKLESWSESKVNCRQIQKRLGAYLDAELEPPQAEEMRDHLARCGACQKELEAMARVVSFVVETAEHPFLARSLTPPFLRTIAARRAERLWRGPRWMRLAWAGGLAGLLILGLNVCFFGLRGGGRGTSVPPFQSDPARMAQEVTFPRAASEAPEFASSGDMVALLEGAGMEVRPSGERTWRPAVARMALHAEDRVRTPPGKEGELTLRDGSWVKLNAGTVLEVRRDGLVLVQGQVQVSAQPQLQLLYVYTLNGAEAEVVGTRLIGAQKFIAYLEQNG
jgi:anti-sigma factor RsiW